jgi:hypothetical protein
MTQTIECKCGNTFAACNVPSCYTDKQWLKDLSIHVKNGCTVSLVDDNKVKFSKCVCDEVKDLTDIFDTVIYFNGIPKETK